MTQQLWIANSSLLAFFIVAFFLTQTLSIKPPRVASKKPTITKKTAPTDISKQEVIAPSQVNWGKIYKNDIFDTFVPTLPKPEKKELVTPIPEPKAPPKNSPPELPQQNFVESLKVSIKGIIIAPDEARNVAMIEDETKKEGLFHLGEKIKDAQIIKITRNRVVFLRGNGQQETFFLRKEDVKIATNTPDKWKYIIRKVDNNTYEIDPDNFREEISSLGSLLERSAIVGTAYQGGKPIGLRIGAVDSNDIGQMLGLKQNDILTVIDNITTAEMKNRIKIYDAIVSHNIGDEISISLLRNGNQEQFSYKLVKISKATEKLFSGEKEEKKDQELKLSKTQEREKLIRDFKDRHQNNNPQQQQAVAQIRQRLLENLRSRLKNARIR